MESEPEPANLTAQFILIFILTLLNAFLAASEMAIVSLNKNKLRVLAEEGNKKAKLLIDLLAEPTKFLSTIQVGITFAGFFSSASAATGISKDFGQYLAKLSIPYSSQIALIVVTIILSFLTLVFGELFPKRIALQKPESIAMFSIRPILFISKITVPFVRLLSASTNILVRIVGLDKENLDEMVSKEEIKSLVEVGQENGVFNETEKEMINSIFEFDNKLATEVMTPRPKVYLVDVKRPLNEYLDELIDEGYSRIPVFEDDIDNIIGILYIKDLFAEARKHGFDNVNIRSILQPAYFVPETKNIDELFKELQNSRVHLAVLIDEYGGFSGIVSIEDLIEEVMGNIEDEYDKEDSSIKKIDNDTFMIDGMITLNDFNDYFNVKIESDDYDTLNGFLIDLLGHIPMSAEEKNIEYENFIFKIEEIQEKRIEKIKVYVQKQA